MEIKDKRLTPTMERTRSGRIQLFREKDCTDRSFINSDNADVILEPPSKELYADLIEGKWHWVSGCAECNGEPRNWDSYIECEKHDVCRSCARNRSEFDFAVWGGRNGWQCNECREEERIEKMTENLSKVAERGYSDLDFMFNENITCPHCGEQMPDNDHDEGRLTCGVCNGKFELEHNYEITYSTTVVGERITL